MSSTPQRSAFTLIELVIVLVVFAVLAAIAIPTFALLVDDARDRSTLLTVQAVVGETVALAFGGSPSTEGLAIAVGELPGDDGVWQLRTTPGEYSDAHRVIHGGVTPEIVGAAARTPTGRCAYARASVTSAVRDAWLSSGDVGEECNSSTAVAGPSEPPSTPTTTTPTTTTTTTTVPGGGTLSPPPGLFPGSDTSGATQGGWPNVGAVFIVHDGWPGTFLDLSGNDPGTARGGYSISAVEWSFDAGASWYSGATLASAPGRPTVTATESLAQFYGSGDALSDGIGTGEDVQYWDSDFMRVENWGGGVVSILAGWSPSQFDAPALSNGDIRMRVRYSYTHSAGTGEGTAVAILDNARPPSASTTRPPAHSYTLDISAALTGASPYAPADCATPVDISELPGPSQVSWGFAALASPTGDGGTSYGPVVDNGDGTSSRVISNEYDPDVLTVTVDHETGALCWSPVPFWASWNGSGPNFALRATDPTGAFTLVWADWRANT